MGQLAESIELAATPAWEPYGRHVRGVLFKRMPSMSTALAMLRT